MFKGQSSFEKVFQDYKKTVEGVVFRIAGEGALEDLTQETFIKVWSGLPLFYGKSTLRTWIYRIAVNVSIDYCRKHKAASLNVGHEVEVNSSEGALANKQLVELGLNSLTPNERAVVVLFYFEDLSIEEIGRCQNSPQGTVKSLLSRARKKLKEVMLKEFV